MNLAARTNNATSPSCDLTGADTGIKKQTAAVYNDLGWKVAETDPLGKTWSASHDKHGNVLTALDAKNQTTVLTWNYGHQLKTRSVKNADGSVYKTETVTRNPLGQPVNSVQSTPAIQQTFAYDPAHRLIRHSDTRNGGAAKVLTYDWSPGGMLNLMQDSDGNRTDYLYDGVGRLAGIWAPNFDYLAFSHDAGGRLTEKWHPNGHTARFTWNPDGSLATLVNRTAANVILSSHSYQYDNLGRRYRHSETSGTLGTQHNQYVYDPLSRLLQSQTCASTYTGCTAQETLTYDIWDNRKTRTAAGSTLAYVKVDPDFQTVNQDGSLP
jgi:YD repeat-containing protein